MKSKDWCSMTEAGLIPAETSAVARRLAGAGAEIRPLQSGGRNSRIYRVDSDGVTYALKQYPSKEFDPRDRLATEVGALRLMAQAELATVPRVIAVDRERGYALLSWLEGAVPDQLTDGDINAAVSFLGAIHALRTTQWAGQQPAAAEACLSGTEIGRQLSARRARLQSIAAENLELADFLDKTFDPAHRRLLDEAQERLVAERLDFAADLPQERRSLVPSDFGFHNSLRHPDGSLAFVDFEYFGWDDPVKMTADILLHPGHQLSASHRRQFRQSAIAVYGADADFAPRIGALLPLFGLRWTLILLNEFLPERWQNRLLAGTVESWDTAKTRQLTRARDFLSSLATKLES
jgi:fructosamine-3-kinase